MVERFERFSLAISEISRYWHKIASDEMEKYGMKGPLAIYLVALRRFGDGITATKLCELCSKDKSDVSRAVALMEKNGLIEKHGANYRAVLKLTEEGVKAADIVRERAAVAVDFAGGEISDEKREILYETLELIAANLQKLSKQGIPQKGE